MNCKQGDLAVIVRSRLGLEGVFVRCVRLHGSTTHEMLRLVGLPNQPEIA